MFGASLTPLAQAVHRALWLPLRLFEDSTDGLWYDVRPQTCFQDANGITPCEVGDPVGLLLDSGQGASASDRVNLLTHSEAFDNAAWTKANATVTADATTDPNGVSTADKLVEDLSTSTYHRVQLNNVTLPSASTVTGSIYAKAAERSQIYLQLYNDAGDGTFGGATFDLSAGTVLSSLSGTTASVESAGSGWYRCTVTATPTAAEAWFLPNIASGGTQIYSGDGTSGIYIWGAQLEKGDTASDYQPAKPYWHDSVSGHHATQSTSASKPTLMAEPSGLDVEEVTNGTFDTDTTGWTQSSGASLSIVSGAIRVENTGTGSGYAHQVITTEVGKWYEVKYGAVAESSANLDFRVGTGEQLSEYHRDNSIAPGSSGSAIFEATTTTTYITLLSFNSSSLIGSYTEWDNVSVREVTGWHRYYLEFDGVDDYLDAGTAITWASTDHFAIAAVRVDGGSGDTLGSGGTGGNHALLQAETATVGYARAHVWRGGTAYTVDIPIPDGSFLVAQEASGTVLRAYVDGSKNPDVTTASATSSQAGLLIGTRGGGDTANLHDGRVYGVVVVTKALSDADRKRVERFLADRSGVTL